ncbi:hypothetical protein MJO29_006444 [Puccinia striiformis f. sp. tritici]|uniref:Uncharacterized protein n=1 Tax=Puccinia striiformis f. sp. tritici PST-78 TaxID=1165861 RepID=A0A0L0VIK6_9BASI|nr:hypothetical protein MJO29_006444 [Puccinia striiformis f. sp. tritici]KNE99120.1 hypothetical protein PSTG_07599 [Puccinia striiformis f. sp. tritici PST-78]
MSSTRAPNHPVNISGCFETLDVSVPESIRANQYGNVSTPSCVSCAGFLGNKAEDIQLTLITNTALSNLLQPSMIYFLTGRLLALNDGSSPVLTYQQNSLVRLTPAGTTAPDLANKASVVGLGLVTQRQLVVSDADDGSQTLHVTVQHSDWDSVTHDLYVVGREVEITGHLVDFYMDNFTAIVSVNSVSVTSGHQIGRTSTLVSASPSGSKNGRTFKTFSPSKSKQGPSQPSVDPLKDGFTPEDQDTDMLSCDQSTSDPNGKRKAEQPCSSGTSDTELDLPIAPGNASKDPSARPPTTVLQDVVKRLKHQ